MNILHAGTGMALAMLLELFAGNWGVVIPFAVCVLDRITEKFPLPWMLVTGFCSGLVFDLIFWRKFPAAALSTALTLLLVRAIVGRAKIGNRFFRSLYSGFLIGLFSVLLMALLNGYPDGRRFPLKSHLFSAVAGALIFRTLISPVRSNDKELPERKSPPQEEKGEKKKAPRKRSTQTETPRRKK
jgi:cell shape-determining protein MreD